MYTSDSPRSRGFNICEEDKFVKSKISANENRKFKHPKLTRSTVYHNTGYIALFVARLLVGSGRFSVIRHLLEYIW